MRSSIGVGDHAADVLTDDMDWGCNFQMVVSNNVQVIGDSDFVVSEFWM